MRKTPIARYMHFGQNPLRGICILAKNALRAICKNQPKHVTGAQYALVHVNYCDSYRGRGMCNFSDFVHIACNAHLPICRNESRCTGRAICTGRATNISPFAICVTMVYICVLHVHIARNLHIGIPTRLRNMYLMFQYFNNIVRNV